MSSRYISTTVLAATAAAFILFGSSGGIAMAYETSNKGQSLTTNKEVNTFDINFHPMQSEELYSTYGRHDDGRDEEVTSSSALDKVGIALSSQYHTYGGGKGGDNDDQPNPPKLAKAEKTSAPTVSPIDDESSAASYFGIASSSTLEGSNEPTDSPTPITQHELHGTAIDHKCLDRLLNGMKLTKDCELWISKNPQFTLPTSSPTNVPSTSPTIFAELIKEVQEVVIVDDVDESTTMSSDNTTTTTEEAAIVVVVDDEEEEGDSEEIYDFEGNLVEEFSLDGGSTGDNTTATSPTSSTFLNNSTFSSSSSNVTTAVKLIYTLSPTDDTFIEKWRSSDVLGNKDKLKIDATEDGMPTKVILLKFGMQGIYNDVLSAMEEMEATDMELSSADLTLHAISSTSFGGYILPNDSSNWSEESTTWDDIIRGGKDGLDAQDLLPSEDSPSITEFGSVLSGDNVTADIKLEVLKTLCCMDDNTMSLRIVTNSSDGVIYASKEHTSDKGPVMKLEFLLSRNATTSSTSTGEEEESVVNDILDVVTAKPTTSPSSLAPVIPIPASARPLKDEVGELTPIESEPDWIVDEGPAVVVVEEMSNSSTSVISSSFSMSITAIEEVTEWRNRRHLRASHEKQDRYLQENVVDANQSFQDKEGPAIAEHLARVYASVLSIAPTSISIVEEDPLVVQNNTATGGVIRESTFRVDAKFDDPEVSNIEPEDAAAVLDQATIYSFIGEEKAKFIEIYKNTGSPIVNEPADYDVTVIKEETLSADATSPIEGEAPGSSPTTNDSSEWLTPTLISVASIVVVASTAAAGLLWKHRRGSGGSGSTYKRGGDSPRSLDPTAAQTPSPYAFANRFKSKKKFDYEEFDDDEAVENPARSLSPLTCEIASPAAVSHKAVPQINFPDISFDDSSTGVSDVGVKAPQLETPDMNPSELLLDTTLDSYNVTSASGYAGLDDGSHSVEAATPLYDTTGDHSNLSVDSSLLQHENATSGYGAHLFTMDMLRNKDTNLLEMPPPPSDVASDSSSHQDDVDSLGDPIVRSDTVFTMREKSEQEAVTQTINNELSKVMELLKSPEAETSSVGINVLVDDDESTSSVPEKNDLLMTDRGRSNSVAEAVKRLETQVAEQKEEEEESSSLVTQRLED